MSAYRVGWLVLVGLVVTGGLLLARLALPTAALVVLAFAGAGLGVGLHPHPVRLIGIERATVSPIWFSVVSCSVGLVALSGLLWGVGASGTVALVALLAIVWVPLWQRRGWTQQEAAGVRPSMAQDVRSPAPSAVQRPVDVHTWSNANLCWAWRWSFTELHRARSGTALARVADERRLYLDEIERRDPRAFALWISAGARAAGDPLRYLGVGSDRSAS